MEEESLDLPGRSLIPYVGLGVRRLESRGLLLKLSSSESVDTSEIEGAGAASGADAFFMKDIGRDGRAPVGAGPLSPGNVRERSRNRKNAELVGEDMGAAAAAAAFLFADESDVVAVEVMAYDRSACDDDSEEDDDAVRIERTEPPGEVGSGLIEAAFGEDDCCCCRGVGEVTPRLSATEAGTDEEEEVDCAFWFEGPGVGRARFQ